MFLSRPFAARRVTILAMLGALAMFTFFVLPQAQAAASGLLLLFRGQTIMPVPTDMKHLKSAYDLVEELEHLGSLQGAIPRHLNTVSGIGGALQLTHFDNIAQPGTFPANVSHTPSSVRAIGPSQVVLTFEKATADAYFQRVGSSQTFPLEYDGLALVVDFPAVSVVEYAASQGGAKLYVGQAGQLEVSTSGNLTIDELKDYLIGPPGISSDAAAALRNLKSLPETMIPLGIPIDKVRWSTLNVGGGYGGRGVFLDGNTSIGSAALWQTSDGKRSLGVGGWGLKGSDVQNVANSLH